MIRLGFEKHSIGENQNRGVKMKRHRIKLIFSMLFVLFLITPGAVSGMSAPPTSEYNLPPPASGVAPTDTPFTPHPSAPDPEMEVASTAAVYVDNTLGSANTNFNSGPQRGLLLVAPQIEFSGEKQALIRFHPISLPEGAEITDARIRLYQQRGPTVGAVKMYALEGGFNEETVTWNTKPPRGASQSITETGGGSGLRFFDISPSLVRSWIQSPGTNYGVVLVYEGLTPYGWEFSSDESGSPPTLIISYTGAPPPPPTPPPAEDTEQCQVSYTVIPSSPSPGQQVTITATATDNERMAYIELSRGGIPLVFEGAEAGERTLTVSATVEAQLPVLQIAIRADDFGPAAAVREDIWIDVVGTGTIPEVSVEAEWEIRHVIPERYRLIRGDGQTVTITATATDPDGIEHLTIFLNGVPHDFRYDGQTSASETLTWVNDEPSRTRFYYSAAAQDREGNYVTADGENFNIAQLEDLTLMWHAAPGFHNVHEPRLSWTRMVQAFGADECWWVRSWDWKNPYALIWYHAGFKDIADGGECWGMSALATEIYHGRILARDLEFPLMASQLSYANSYTKEYVQARQGGQLGEEVVEQFIDQSVNWIARVGYGQELERIENDLINDTPGVIGIAEIGWVGGWPVIYRGHAIVPWMTRHMGDGTTRVYVYDCNRACDSDTGFPDGMHNPNADFNNFQHYPYMEVTLNDWSYVMANATEYADGTWDCPVSQGETWNDRLYYYSYDWVVGNPGETNALGEAGDAPRVADQDLPNLDDVLIGAFSGDADVYVEDDAGNVTGIYEGKIREEIPGSVLIVPMLGGSFTDHEMYALPIDARLSIHVVGQGEGEYTLGLMGGYSLYALEDKSLSEGVEDIAIIEPFGEAVLYRLRVQPGEADDDFTVRIAHMFIGRVEALDRDSVDREYIVEDISASEESDFSVYVEEGGDSLVVESYEDDIEFDVTMRSTESTDYVDPEEELLYIPSSTEEDLSVGRGERVEATPEDWATTEERGEMHTLRRRVEGEAGGVGFPIIPVVIGVAVVGAIVIVLKKGVFGKAKKG